ncbi:PQ loop repeat family protein [Loa loa]|uniref:Mannose-P-dolichol utilization defect 1 protein homolog n=2 Tax=Loa loa TaxID=7209 RepID=A0A1S0TYL6_LOALO|nr:PQ loop repeat family protein [Loa loa]EFO22514.2 PQ loop repeat family protein [Loa loa]
MKDLIISKTDQLLHFIFPNRCYEIMLLKYNFLHQECISMVTSRMLGLGLTLGSLLIFIPQILKIQFAQSGEGISLSSQLLGLFACFTVTSYSYAKGYVFSQWGDSFFVTIQMVIIIIQIFWFSSRQTHAAVFFAFCWTISCAVMGEYIPNDVLALLQAITIPIVIVAKFLQIRANYQQQSTGQLSVISVFLQFAGCLARIFTSLKETGDQLVIINYIIAALLNGIIFIQFLLYWGGAETKKKVS